MMTNQSRRDTMIGGEQLAEAISSHEASEFERRLAARTKVPLDRLDTYLALSEDDIRAEVDAVVAILRRFADAVVSSMDDPDTTTSFLRELDLKTISRDHDWRAIFSTIRGHGPGYEGHKRAVLVKYLQYLSFRKKLLTFIYAKKSGLSETDEFPADLTAAEPGYGAETGARSRKRGAKGEAARVAHARLPLGEPVRVELPVGSKVEMVLAGHVFRLIGTRVPCLVDQNGVMYFLKEGRNMVGRHPESDVCVDPNFRDVSRAHCIIEWDEGESAVSITDLSSRGTYVRADAVTRTAALLGGEH